MKTWLSRTLATLAATAGLVLPGLSQNAVVTITWEVEVTGPNHDCTTTLYDDGTITTEVDWAPDPDDVNLPSGIIPPGMTATTEDIPGALTEEDAKAVIGAKIARKLIGAWIEYGLEQLEEFFDNLLETLEEAGETFSEWLDGLFGGDDAPTPDPSPFAQLFETLASDAAQNPAVLDDNFNGELAKVIMNGLKDYYDTL